MLIRITDLPETFVPLGIRLLLRIFKNKITFYDKSSKSGTLGQNFTGCYKKDAFDWKCISWKGFISGMFLHNITSVKSKSKKKKNLISNKIVAIKNLSFPFPLFLLNVHSHIAIKQIR